MSELTSTGSKKCPYCGHDLELKLSDDPVKQFSWKCTFCEYHRPNTGYQNHSLNELRDAIYEDAVAHGLWEEHDYYYSQMKSVQAICPEAEIDVAMEEKEHCARLIESECYELAGASEDAELYSEELADVIIMSMSVAGRLGIDIDAAIRRKMEINKQRPWKHGKEEKA